MLAKAINWLAKRFPEQLTVSKQDWTELRQEMAQYNVLYQAVQQLNERLAKIEANVGRLNTANGFTDTRKGPATLER